MAELKRLDLHDLHVASGARMMGFAGYEMPVQYGAGVMAEHQHSRQAAGLFDVSHMGQVILRAPGGFAEVAQALETLIPADIAGLTEGRQRYGLFTNDAGGILDDLMLANRGDHVLMVVNAGCKAADLAHMRAHLAPMGIEITEITDRALLALQGPAAEAVLSALAPGAAEMRFMDVATLPIGGAECWVARAGYTGEDGFEISVPATAAEALARALLDDPRVLPVGLGARDSLRLEAGLCLYGHDIDTTTTPAAAGLGWAIGKARRHGGARAGGFPGADTILAELSGDAAHAPAALRVGLRPEGRAPMREGVTLHDAEAGGAEVGRITSGGFGPTVGGPVAMGYVPPRLATPGTTLWGELRGKRLPLVVAPLPFTPANFKR